MGEVNIANGKLKVTQKVADALDGFIAENQFSMSLEEVKSLLVAEHFEQDWHEFEEGQFSALNDIETFDVMQAMVNGYEVEKSPEE